MGTNRKDNLKVAMTDAVYSDGDKIEKEPELGGESLKSITDNIKGQLIQTQANLDKAVELEKALLKAVATGVSVPSKDLKFLEKSAQTMDAGLAERYILLDEMKNRVDLSMAKKAPESKGPGLR